MKNEMNYNLIDNLVKNNKLVFMFFQYGLDNYSNRIIFTNNKFYIFNVFGLYKIKNINIINDIRKNCFKNINKKYLEN